MSVLVMIWSGVKYRGCKVNHSHVSRRYCNWVGGGCFLCVCFCACVCACVFRYRRSLFVHKFFQTLLSPRRLFSERPSTLLRHGEIKCLMRGAAGAAATPKCQTGGPNEKGDADNGFPHLSLWVLRSVSIRTCAPAARCLLSSQEMAAPVSSRFKALINHTRKEGRGRAGSERFSKAWAF